MYLPRRDGFKTKPFQITTPDNNGFFYIIEVELILKMILNTPLSQKFTVLFFILFVLLNSPITSNNDVIEEKNLFSE